MVAKSSVFWGDMFTTEFIIELKAVGLNFSQRLRLNNSFKTNLNLNVIIIHRQLSG